jgi:hypothetical protein
MSPVAPSASATATAKAQAAHQQDAVQQLLDQTVKELVSVAVELAAGPMDLDILALHAPQLVLNSVELAQAQAEEYTHICTALLINQLQQIEHLLEQ